MSFAVVTGAAKGLGHTIALFLASSGYDLVLHYRSNFREVKTLSDKCQEMGSQTKIIQSDFSDPLEPSRFAKKVMKEVDAVGVVVNNVGEYLVGPLSEVCSDEWNQIFQVNLHAPVLLTHALLPSLIKAKGCVINIGCTGLEGPKAARHSPAYRCTKVALLSWTRSLAAELIEKGVRVNMVSPGRLENSVDLTLERLNSIPAGRPGTLEEVAKVVTWLTSPDNSYITGQNIEVAGGLLL